MVELSLELGVVVVAWLVSLFIAIFAVPRLVAPKARQAWTKWLMSEESEPWLDRMAQRVIGKLPAFPVVPKTDDFMEAIEPRIQGLEDRINQPIQLDLDPVILKVSENVRMEVDKIRSVIDGKLGFATKVLKQTGEEAGNIVGTQIAVAAGVDPTTAQLYQELTSLLGDEKWVKDHPAAAIGLRILKANTDKVTTGQSTTYRPGLGRR